MKITEESMKLQEIKEAGNHADPPEQIPAPAAKQTEREKLRAMSPKEKHWYIWEYYKFHIIGAVIAVCVLVSLGKAFYQSSYDTVLYCFYLNSSAGSELSTAPLEQGFAEYMELGRKEQITVESGSVSFDDTASEYNYAIMAKISALVMSHELDVMIGDTASTDEYAALGAFLDLEAQLSPELLDLVRDRLYYAKGADGTEQAVAIDLSGTGFAASSNLAQDVPLLAFLGGSQHQNMLEPLIRYIFTSASDNFGAAVPGSSASAQM